jgi:hypothetical protein
MNEELKALQEEFGLSEEGITKLNEMVQGLVDAHKVEIETLKEETKTWGDALILEMTEKGQAYGDGIKAELTAKLDQYTDYVAEEFIKENKEQLVKTDEYARMKGAFDMIKEAFESNGFSVNEDARLTEMTTKLQESVAAYEKIFGELEANKTLLENQSRELFFLNKTRNLADTQVEKVRQLMEAVTFDSKDEFEAGVTMMLEQVKEPADKGAEEMLNEQVDAKAAAAALKQTEDTGKYVSALRVLSKK